MKNPYFCSCIVCHKVYSSKGIHTHFLISHTDYKIVHKENSIKGSLIGAHESAKVSTDKRKKNIKIYNLSPRKCKNCKTSMNYNQRKKSFCSRSCSASYNNSLKILGTQLEFNFKFKKRKKTKEIYPYTKIHFHKCKICNMTIIDKKSIKSLYCDLHKKESSNKRSYYRFKFNIFNYPNLFDLELIKQKGFYGPGGKSNRYNLSGLSRDHKVSIADAIQHNYPQYYISHPINCQIISHKENNKKKHNSSMSFEQLKYLVDYYDQHKILPDMNGAVSR